MNDVPQARMRRPKAGIGHEAQQTTQSGIALRVLVVDDNQDAADLLAMVLQLDGHHTQVAYDGRMAIDWAAEFHPDVVLLDIGLPGMDGYEVAQHLRQMPILYDTKLIAITGYEEPERAAAAGFSGYLVKPVDPDQLRKLLLSARPAAASA